MANGLGNFFETLQFLGAGMAGGNVGASLANLSQLRQARAQLAANQRMQERRYEMQEREWEREEAARQRAERDRLQLQAIAPQVMEEAAPGQTALAQYAAMDPTFLRQVALQQVQPPAEAAPTSLARNLVAAGLQPGSQEFQQAMMTAITKPQTQVQIGGGPERGAVPQGMVRVEDPTTPSGTRLIAEPGAPSIAKREEQQAAERRKKLDPINDLQDSLNRYKRVLQETGPELLPGQAKDRLTAAYTDLLLKQKEAANLGVLSGPDLALMEQMLSPPTTVGAQMKGEEALFAQLDQAQAALDDAKARAEGREPIAPTVPGEPIQIKSDADYDALPSGTLFVDPEGTTRRKP